MKVDLQYLWYCSTCHNFNDPRTVICPTCNNYRIDYPPSSDSSLDPEDTIFSPKNSSDEQEAVDGGSENSNTEAENSKGDEQKPGNVIEESGQETTSPEEKDGGGDIDPGNVPAGVESDDDEPGPSAGNNYRSGKMEKGGDQVEGDEKAKGKNRSTQLERNARKKILTKRGPKKQKVKSDDDLAEKFENQCNSSDEGPKKKCPRK